MSLFAMRSTFFSSNFSSKLCNSSNFKIIERRKINSIPAFLIDKFERRHNYLRISLTEKCNLRCTYCMPENGVPLTPNSNLLTSNEIIRLVEIFANLGVDKIRLTGGEPTLRKDLEDIISRISTIPNIKWIGMTTNGIALENKLEKLAKAGLSALNISLDTLNQNKFVIITRRNGLNKVLNCIKKAETIFDVVKVNVVVIRQINDNEILEFVSLTEHRNLFIRFIEYMPFSGNRFEMKKLVPYKEILKIIENEYKKITKLKDDPNGTSKAYKIDGYRGYFGFISSMTEHFCGTCNRLRITADGNLKVCLHGNSEISLRDLLRSNASNSVISMSIQEALMKKKRQHAGLENLIHMTNRPMILIGG